MAFFHESRPSREPFLNAPATVMWLIGILVATHAARVFAPEPWPSSLLDIFAFLPARYSDAVLLAYGVPPPSLFEKIVPFFSYLFLHGDFMHVGINCLWLLAFGPSVARRFGGVKFYIFFFVCGAIAAAVHLAANWGSIVSVVGASGAIAGLMGAGIRLLYGRNIAYAPQGGLAPIRDKGVLFFTVIWVIINLAAGLTGAFAPTLGQPFFVAWEAHLGGYFAGLVLAGIFDRLRFGRRRTVIF